MSIGALTAVHTKAEDMSCNRWTGSQNRFVLQVLIQLQKKVVVSFPLVSHLDRQSSPIRFFLLPAQLDAIGRARRKVSL